jgi:hypothetical protein
MIRKTLKISVLTSALLMAFPLIASAQSAADLKKEIDLLKGQIEALQKKVESQSAAPAAAAGAVDPDEFNRIKIKTESVEDNFEAAGLKGFKISGMLDPTFMYTQRTDNAGFVFLNNFDGSGRSGGDDRYAFYNSYFGMAMLDIQKETEGGNKWRLTLAPHKSANSAYSLGSIVHEASVSVPLGDLQTRLIAGMIPDWSGYEYIPSNQQPLITHNMLFDFTIPSFYSGVGMEITSGKWISKFMVGNINQARKGDGDKTPGLTYRVDYAKGEFNGFGLAGQHSRSKASKYDLFEVDGYFIRGDLTLQGQIGLGRLQEGAYDIDANTSLQRDARWWGLSGLAGYKVTPRTQLVARLDYINNVSNGGGVFGSYGSSCTNPDSTVTYGALDCKNGFGPGLTYDEVAGAWTQLDANGNLNKGVNRYALSLGMNYLLNPSTTLKFEFRHDRANGNVFLDSKAEAAGDTANLFRKSNNLIGSSIVVSF